MGQTSTMQRSTPAVRAVAAVLFASSLLLAACGTSDGSDASSTTAKADKTTTTAKGGDDDETTTTEADDTTTTEADAPADGPTLDQLADLLPTASDIGDGWTVVPADSDDDEDNALTQAIEEQCPVAAGLGGDDPDEERAEVEFTNDLFQNLSVSLSTDANELSADELAQAIEDINGCGEITSTDESNGLVTSLTFQAEEDTDYGDQGIRLQGDVSLTAPELGDPVEFSLYILSFRDGTVGVSVKGADGIDQDTLAVNTLDPGENIVTLAAAMDEAVGTLG